MTTAALAQARAIVRQLTVQEKFDLLNELTTQLVGESMSTTQERPPFPVLHLDHWPNDVPLRREELYDDRGR